MALEEWPGSRDSCLGAADGIPQAKWNDEIARPFFFFFLSKIYILFFRGEIVKDFRKRKRAKPAEGAISCQTSHLIQVPCSIKIEKEFQVVQTLSATRIHCEHADHAKKLTRNRVKFQQTKKKKKSPAA